MRICHAAAGGRDSEEREGSQERQQGDGEGDANEGGGAEDPAAGGEGGPEDKDAKPQGGGLRMWRAARDRAAWKADVLHVRSCHTIVSNPSLHILSSWGSVRLPQDSAQHFQLRSYICCAAWV